MLIAHIVTQSSKDTSICYCITYASLYVATASQMIALVSFRICDGYTPHARRGENSKSATCDGRTFLRTFPASDFPSPAYGSDELRGRDRRRRIDLQITTVRDPDNFQCPCGPRRHLL